MKHTLTDANFPRTADQRVYHLGLRPGEVANRIVTVGSPSRAKTIALYLDGSPKPFELSSERGFLTITGRYKGVPISIVSIGMGSPNMDFFVREVRESLAGDLVIIRLGSCGGLVDVPVGSVVVPRACVAVNRNVDFDFLDPSQSEEPAYRISKPASPFFLPLHQFGVDDNDYLSIYQVSADVEVQTALLQGLKQAKPSSSQSLILGDVVNASADSFYSSQGRQTSFADHNADLISTLLASVTDLKTLEMETHHLYHLAACWGRTPTPKVPKEPTPLTTSAVIPELGAALAPASTSASDVKALAGHDTVIRVAAAQMVFASRTSQDFITPDQVSELEHWTGKGTLDALITLDIPDHRLHDEAGSVWELPIQ